MRGQLNWDLVVPGPTQGLGLSPAGVSSSFHWLKRIASIFEIVSLSITVGLACDPFLPPCGPHRPIAALQMTKHGCVHGTKPRPSEFAEVGNPQLAICLAPGTELVFDRDVECDHALGFFPTKKMGENTARFRRINSDRPHEHHDALEFPSGRIVLLTRLVAGQRATVLQLPVATQPSEPKSDSEPVRQPSPSEELMTLP